MFLKVDETSSLYKDLYDALMKDRKRQIAFIEWMDTNLPAYNGRVVTQRNPMYQFDEIVGWCFEGEVDRKAWRPLRGFEGYFEPNNHTSVGRAMRKRICEAFGKRFYRLGFFDVFKINIPGGCRWKFPTAFIGVDNVVYVSFDDRCYSDICKNWEGQFVEITHSEWKTALNLLHHD